ncbi:MAG: class I SAM-dependent methyltransferase [Bdellovibrionales bacterium]
MMDASQHSGGEGLNPESRWFGFREVDPDEKTSLVEGVFSSVASRYDLMNDLMSGGLHRLWKDRFVAMMDLRPGQKILDVAGGTGDITRRCWDRAGGRVNITVCDLCPAMMEQGRASMVDHGILAPEFGDEGAIRWVTGNAEELPFPSRSFDICCIAFGLRNVTRIDKALSEFARVLRPGGRFFCLEFSPGVARSLKPIYDRYCETVLPWLGKHVAEDHDSYQYLAESIRQFPPQEELAQRMEQAGFSRAKWLNMTGGIAVAHSGWRL